jgi:membrane dipeptidase
VKNGFLLWLAILCCGVFLAETPARPDDPLWERARALHERLLVLDLHSHEMFKPDSDRWPRQVSLDLLQEGGIDGFIQSFPVNPGPVDHPAAMILADIRSARERVTTEFNPLAIALSAGDLLRMKGGGTPAMLIGVEYFHGLFDGRLETVDDYHAAGVRMIGLHHRGGDELWRKDRDEYVLAEFGAAVIGRMNERGIICDISHLPPQCRRQAIAASRAPVMASHVNARQVSPDPYNLTDETIRLLTEKSGLVCLTFFSESVSRACYDQKGTQSDPAMMPRATLAEWIDHVDYLKKHFGTDHIAIGSDYGGSGRLSPREVETAAGFPLITYHLLQRGYSEAEIRGILGGNFIRLMQQVEQGAGK